MMQNRRASLETTRDKLLAQRERLEAKRKQVATRLKALDAREAARIRKGDTRRKIVIGARMIELAANDPMVRNLLEREIAALTRDQDIKAFEGWTLP